VKIKVLYEKRAILLEVEPSDVARLEDDSERVLVVSDVHIGFEDKFKASGISIQSNYEAMEAELEKLVREHRVTDVLLNGDIKSGIDHISQSEWDNVPRFLARLSNTCRVWILPGNHDGGLVNLMPDAVKLLDINGVLISDTLVLHGHTKPLIKFKDCKRIILGHVHPIFQKRGNPLSGKPVWVFLKMRKKLIFEELLEEESSITEVILMPAFNSDLASSGYAAEAERTERWGAPLVNQMRNAEEAIVLTLQGDVIGDASMLSNIL
jgi:uncharacterized protein